VADVRRDPPALPVIRREAVLLAAQVARFASAADEEARRARELTANLSAIEARVDLLTGTRRTYDAESIAFFGITPERPDPARLAAIRSQIAAIVGREGRLVDRYVAFVAGVTVPDDRLPAVMAAALDECRSRTVRHVALPPREHASLQFVHDRPWGAFSRYLGDAQSAIQINRDFRFTVDQALQIACHEGYPGHHARNAYAAPSRAGRVPAERLVQLMFAPEAVDAEGTAMLAADVAFSPGERVAFVRDRLFPLAGLDPSLAARHVTVERLVGDLQVVQGDIARRYLDGELEFARAVAALEEQALVPHAEGLIKYINEYRTYVTAYTAGTTRFAARLAACAGAGPSADARWRCYADLAFR
jgi:hypothetical protein